MHHRLARATTVADLRCRSRCAVQLVPRFPTSACAYPVPQVLACTARRDARRVAVDSPRRRTRLARPVRPAYRVDGQARRCASRPVCPRRPVARYGARAGLYRSRCARSPSTERRGRTVPHRVPSLRRVATAKRASRGATDPVNTRPRRFRRTEIRSPVLAHVSLRKFRRLH
jgi:hypothetical protein